MPPHERDTDLLLRIPRCLSDYQVRAGRVQPNGIKMLIMSAQDVSVSGFGLAVGFGSYDGDRNFPGLAHLLEHMVLLGSDKFPGPHNWQAFVDSHGNATNASTYPRATHYWATVGPDRLYEAADRIIDFVRAPELNPEYLQKTIEVVNSEAEMRYKNDIWRKNDLQRVNSNPKHPSNIFTIGNNATLNKPGIDQALKNFHQTYYKPQHMSVVAVSNLPVDEMYHAIHKMLLVIPPATEAPERPIGSKYGFPEPMYRPQDLNKYVKSIPISDGTKELSFEFIIEDVRDTYRTLPFWCVTGLLGQEDTGSLTAFFKAKGIASGLLCGVKDSDMGQSRLFVTLELVDPVITSDLIQKAGQAIFAYIRLCLEEGPPEPIVREKIKSAAVRWDNSGTRDVTELVESNNLQLISFPLEEVFTAGNVVLEEDFAVNHAAITHLLSSMSLDRLLVCASSVGFTPTDCPHRTEHYQTPYGVEEFSSEWKREWSNVQTMPWPELKKLLNEWDLHLPRPNPYVPDTLEVIPIATNVDDPPESLHNDPLWLHKLETSFKVPLVELRAFIRFPAMAHQGGPGPLSDQTREAKTALVGVYVHAAIEAANKDLQCALDAHLRAGLSLTSAETHRMGEPGVEVVISGLSDKAPKLFAVIMNQLATWNVRDEDISLALQKYADSIKERICQRRPLDDCFPLIYRAWYPDFVPEDDILASVEALDVATVRSLLCGGAAHTELSRDILEGAQIKIVVAGNVTKEDMASQYLSKEVLGPFYNPIPQAQRLPLTYPIDLAAAISTSALPTKQMMYHVAAPTSVETASNSAVVVAWQMDNMNHETRAIEALLRRWLDRIMYDELRTEESLGYVVSTVILPNTGVGLLVQSEKEATVVLDRMLRFVLERLFNGDTNLVFKPALTPEEFDDFRQAVLLAYKQPPTSLGTQTAYYQRELILERCLFDVRQRQIAFLEALTFDHFLSRVATVLKRPWTVVTVEPAGRTSNFSYPDWTHCQVLQNPTDLLGSRSSVRSFLR